MGHLSISSLDLPPAFQVVPKRLDLFYKPKPPVQTAAFGDDVFFQNHPAFLGMCKAIAAYQHPEHAERFMQMVVKCSDGVDLHRVYAKLWHWCLTQEQGFLCNPENKGQERYYAKIRRLVEKEIVQSFSVSSLDWFSMLTVNWSGETFKASFIAQIFAYEAIGGNQTCVLHMSEAIFSCFVRDLAYEGIAERVLELLQCPENGLILPISALLGQEKTVH